MAISKAQREAVGRYESKNYDKVVLRLRKDTEPTRDTIQKAAETEGMSLNAFIIRLISKGLTK